MAPDWFFALLLIRVALELTNKNEARTGVRLCRTVKDGTGSCALICCTMQCLSNLILNTDSYKASHWLQYPPGIDDTFFSLESRGGVYDRTLFFGLQSILKESLAADHATMVAEARDVLRRARRAVQRGRLAHLIDRHGGKMPMRIRAVPEGTVVPTHQALMTIESTVPPRFGYRLTSRRC